MNSYWTIYIFFLLLPASLKVNGRRIRRIRRLKSFSDIFVCVCIVLDRMLNYNKRKKKRIQHKCQDYWLNVFNWNLPLHQIQQKKWINDHLLVILLLLVWASYPMMLLQTTNNKSCHFLWYWAHILNLTMIDYHTILKYYIEQYVKRERN